MLCKWKYAGPSHAAGFKRYECSRSGCTIVAHSPYGPEKVVNADDCPCQGWPLPHEHSEWLAIFAAAVGITGAIHFCQYIRWRFRGSKLDELPPGVPKPNLVRIPAPAEGPGTELAAIFKAAGASSDQCGGLCQQWIDQMNIWRVEGCRQHRQEIIDRIKAAAYKSWVTEQIRIGWSISREPWWRASDPIGSIVDHAIELAQRRE